MEAVYAATRVVKRLSASQHGAVKLARRYGEALVCVRYRHDDAGRHRYTTVELVVDEAPVMKRAGTADDPVKVRIEFNDAQRRQRAFSLGARWDGRQRLWHMTRRVARQLGLLGSIVKT